MHICFSRPLPRGSSVFSPVSLKGNYKVLQCWPPATAVWASKWPLPSWQVSAVGYGVGLATPPAVQGCVIATWAGWKVRLSIPWGGLWQRRKQNFDPWDQSYCICSPPCTALTPGLLGPLPCPHIPLRLCTGWKDFSAEEEITSQHLGVTQTRRQQWPDLEPAFWALSHTPSSSRQVETHWHEEARLPAGCPKKCLSREDGTPAQVRQQLEAAAKDRG